VVRLQLLEPVEQSLERNAQERMTDNDVWVITLDRGKKGVEKRSLGFDRLERRSIRLGACFKIWWELFDRSNYRVEGTW
jgi:hypothetical protein